MIKEIKFTDKAIKQINNLLSKKDKGSFFRIAIKGGGCSGFQYDFSYDLKPSEDDLVQNNILIDKNNNIIECISSNIFFYTIKKNSFNFVTPDLSNSGVDGIMKKVIIKFMKRKKINISENTIKQKDIRKFHGAFICNSVTGIQFVKKIGEHALSHSRELEAILDKFVYE